MAVERGPAERAGEEEDGVCLQAPGKEGRGDIAGTREHRERRKYCYSLLWAKVSRATASLHGLLQKEYLGQAHHPKIHNSDFPKLPTNLLSKSLSHVHVSCR